MDRESLYFMSKDDKNTFDFDESLPPLPLPELRDTLERYYTCIQPFGTPEELAQARKSIDEFRDGVGAELHEKLKQRAATMKNWLGTWWEDYGYHLLRLPLLPYQLMTMASQLEVVGVPETPEYMLKSFSRIIFHTLEFWDLTRKSAIKPLSSNGGKIKYSSALYKRFFSTSRIPGVEQDHIEKHFLTKDEGNTPTHVLIGAKGRQFIINCVHDDDTILTAPEILVALQRLRSILDYEPEGAGVPILSHDDRPSWANNRARLMEISDANKETLKLVEGASMGICWDENTPQDYEECSQLGLYGDTHSRWADHASSIIAYRNGRYNWTGEHSCYDGTVSVSFATFMQLSMLEVPEPDWGLAESTQVVELQELKFELDDTLKSEITRLRKEKDERGIDITATFTVFDEYGKDFMKSQRLHPDSFIQVVMQWTFHQMHEEIAPTYETALMRQYYNGRTETLRSCTGAVAEFLKASADSRVSDLALAKSFRTAVDDHKRAMDEARKGNGIDRHLFGLWCAAYENKLDIPAFYDDPLYAKSGGGGNFVLSSSTLGFTANVGFVAPMLIDGYGVFYSITSGAVFINTTAYRDSIKTSARKFNDTFKASFRRISVLLEQLAKESKL
ncbi:peroxisomal carnitine O-octanoyltransferase [Drosophila miranda]|uniref:peroxisomal carnitine O-octanoyltransferase n=1 Tax=Drosophila miranda TaxID=7229 RepID=UPI0007E7C13E|nr:peroxisomal carnitine O-octanoyltransferase [Drosophila miranda]XP_017141475.1 peroxisomal carnitine O-octanoyltransferase [Drosophila miranda]XP_017141476.1 peroxisomal carnitine O-octanoyltransferase [Drosophila miranda]XP_017141477.1 peroxisomal carnitine O-octanoyltransferase [Drosophila miranda]